MRFLLIILVLFSFTACNQTGKDIFFMDDFESGGHKWDFVHPTKFKIQDSGDPKHGKVLVMHPGGPAAYALIKDSHNWTNVKIEGDLFFPHNFPHYMGLIYNYNIVGDRADFGCIYVYGPYAEELNRFIKNYPKYMAQPPDHFIGNSVLVNPHRDSNASRRLYWEYWVVLTGDKGVKPGEWHHFKAEVMGSICHFYIDDMKIPKITFDDHEFSSGRVGFKPRYAGFESWLDNIKVTSIKTLSYNGPGLPAGRNYKPDKLITKWQVIGPFVKRIEEIENDGYQPGKVYVHYNKNYRWEPFETDARGCVLSGKVCDRFSGRWITYFHTEISSQSKKEVTLEFSSTNPLILWVNRQLAGRVKSQVSGWYDFWENPEHKGETVKVTLNPGTNHIVVLTRGGNYGGDGFFAYRREE